MPLFRPIRSWSDLPSVPPAAAAETYFLDFKARHQRDSSEQAKDMAAFANLYGGVVLVGAAESADSFDQNLMPIAEAQVAARDYEHAARELLSPRPLVDPCIVRLPADPTRALVAVNIDAFPGQLVGARVSRSEAWRFPVRVAARHTTYLDPEKAMLHSDPRTRKAAILLSSIEPMSQTILVQIMERREDGATFINRDAVYEGQLKSIDVQKNNVELQLSIESPRRLLSVWIPLEDVQAVWVEATTWTIRVDGAVRHQRLSGARISIRYISGRGPYDWR